MSDGEKVTYTCTEATNVRTLTLGTINSRCELDESKKDKSNEPSFSRVFAFVYILNLIVGVGALAMPKAFAMAGWLLGLVLLVVLAMLSYMTATYVIEAMAVANAYARSKNEKIDGKEQSFSSSQKLFSSSIQLVESTTELTSPLISMSDTDTFSTVVYTPDYSITHRYELGDMANLFFNKVGIALYYIAIILYLYGDLSIYLVTVPKSMLNITCIIPRYNNSNANSSNGTAVNRDCFGVLPQIWFYRIYLVVFILILGPFVFFNLSKSKWLQLITAVMRNVAFIMMIVIALVFIGRGDYYIASVANFASLPNLFGVIIYAYMCQHSLPGMVTPLKNKRGVNILMLLDFVGILLYYSALSFSAAFRFNPSEMEDVYTLNFFNIGADPISYYLALFPVFTLSTNFPIIAITLRENLKSLYRYIKCLVPRLVSAFPLLDHWSIDRLLFPLVAILPPLLIAFFTMDVELLVGITGSYAGVCVQYLIPVALVFFSRRVIIREKGQYVNPHKSPFSHWILLLLIVIWSFICVIIITIDRLDDSFHFLTPRVYTNHTK